MPTIDGVWREPTNHDRSLWAQKALLAYAKETRPGWDLPSDLANDEVFREIASDLLCDLLHLADTYRVELDWGDLITSAVNNHDEEVAEQV